MRTGIRGEKRRGAALIQVALMTTILLGAASLTVDIGLMYVSQAELQNAADAAARAGAARLAEYTAGDPQLNAAAEAMHYAELNTVLGDGATLSAGDVIFGHGVLQSGNKYVFQTGGAIPDAVRVTVRRTSGSPDGPIPLIFARIWGIASKDMQATATAMLIPRDVAIVADLSGSHSYDSQLRHCRMTTINNHDVWNALPDGLDEFDPQHSGPSWGHMTDLGWGDVVMDPDTYDPRADAGLAHLPSSQNWDNAALSEALAARGYSAEEVSLIMSDRDHYYKSRVAVALGLAIWRSGRPGGYGDQMGLSGGDGDSRIESGEITWTVDYPYNGGSWSDYMDYVRSSASPMCEGDSNFKYKYGLKTFVDYLLMEQRSNAATPQLASTPAQPMQAVKDAVGLMMGILDSFESDDRVSLEIYATRGRHEVDLTEEYSAISARLNALQAAHYDGWTNIGDGIRRGIEELTSERVRPSAKKTMLLLTDGNANTDEHYQWNLQGAYDYAVQQAQQATALGIRIYCITVGADADQGLMTQIATISGTQNAMFHAGGDIAQTSAQLQEVFAQLGGLRPVLLID